MDVDPACGVRHHANGDTLPAPEIVLSNSFGFGGVNAVLVLRRG